MGSFLSKGLGIAERKLGFQRIFVLLASTHFGLYNLGNSHFGLLKSEETHFGIEKGWHFIEM